jgi:putative ATPase
MLQEEKYKKKESPLADRIRPENLDEFLGQDEIIGVGKMLRQAIEKDNLPSLIFWGPPGSGKTTLAHIIANKSQAEFVKMSAVTSGVKDLKEVIRQARENKMFDKRTILFVDEIHRWNKSQQDALLPHIEDGTIVLLGATTENPSFEVRSALLSRCRVLVLKQLQQADVKNILQRAIADEEKGLGAANIDIAEDVLDNLAGMSNGDARVALNVLEYAVSLLASLTVDAAGISRQAITFETIKEAFQKAYLLYDKNGEEHYNIISALHKSMRGSDANAAIYWLARMLEAGEDPLYIARRLVRFASEDIGLANSRALEQAVAAYQACHFLGIPECNVVLSQAVVYMARCKKSNELYTAYKNAARDAHEFGNQPVPLHIRNAPTKLMQDLGYGQNYKYSPDYEYTENQEYLPEKLKGRKYLK